MERPTLFWYGLDEERKGILHATSAITHDETLRGDDVITFSCEEAPEKYDRVLWWDFLDSCWREHIVRETYERSDGLCKVSAEGTLSETRADFLEEVRLIDAAHWDAVEKVLPHTRLALGTKDYESSSTLTRWLTRINVYDALREMEDAYNVEFYIELVVDEDAQKVVERKLATTTELGTWRGKRFTRGKNLPDGYKHVKADEVLTAMYGYGASLGAFDEEGNPTAGYTRRLTFGDINSGRNYVENEEALERYGRPRADGSRQNNFGYVVFDHVDKPRDLYVRTNQALNAHLAELVDYRWNGELDCTGEDVRLGDTVLIADELSGAPVREFQRVARRVRVFDQVVAQTVRLGPIGSGRAMYRFRALSEPAKSYEDVLVLAGLAEPAPPPVLDALNIAIELHSAKRADGAKIDLAYSFELLEGDRYVFDITMQSASAVTLEDVSVVCERGELTDEFTFYGSRQTSKYKVEITPNAAERASGRMTVTARVSCPAGTLYEHEAYADAASITLPLTDVQKPTSTVPGDLTGDGTFEHPHTVADLLRCECVSTTEAAIVDVWVSGSIVGWADMSGSYRLSEKSLRLSAEGAEASNIVLADRADETDVGRMVAVNLTNATRNRKAVRAALNLKDNPEMLGRRVYVFGDVVLYGGVSGLKRVDRHRYEVDGYWKGWDTYLGQLGEEFRS